jgi:hypothetical protein
VSIPQPQSPAEGFATILRCLVQAVAAMSGGDRLTYRVIGLIADRIRVVNQRFRRLAARLRAGTYRPRHGFRRRKAIDPKPRRPNPLPRQFGWLQPLVPEAVQFRAQLEHHLRDPEMVALMAQAPASMARTLRPLCWMLRVTPPPILALPRRRPRPEAVPPESAPPPAPDPTPRQAAARPARRQSPRRSPPPAPPARPAPPMRRGPPRACGPPHPA